MPVRALHPEERADAVAMMRALWPDAGDADLDGVTVLVWEREEPAARRLGGFVAASLREWAEGCESTPVPYVEGWWVAPELRGTGVGRALIAAVEAWCVANGHTELASDVEVENTGSLQAHAALGFEPTVRLQYFRKRLGRPRADGVSTR